MSEPVALATARARPRTGGSGGRRPTVAVISAVVLVAAWHIVSLLAGETGAGVHTVPSAIDIAKAFPRFADYWKGGLGVEPTSVSGETTWQGAVLGFLYNTGLTAFHTIAGVALGIAVGLGVAVAISWSSVLRGIIATPGHFARMLPLLAMAPLFALWFGNTDKGAILFTAFVAFSLVFPIAITAIGNVPGFFGQYAASLGASRWYAYRTVVIPAALPELRGGIMLAVGFGWSAAIAAEYIGSDFGLGHIVQNAEFFGRTNVLALVATVAFALAATSFFLVSRLLGWATRWAE